MEIVDGLQIKKGTNWRQLAVVGVLSGGMAIYGMAGTAMLTVESGSMGRAIPTGSVVWVQAKQFGYQAGEVITFRNGNRLVTHRVNRLAVKDGELVYETKGDVNKEPDAGLVAGKVILGRVLFHLPYLGYMVDWIRTPVGLIALIIVPATIVIYEEIQKIRRELRLGGLGLLAVAGLILVSAQSQQSKAYLNDVEVSLDNGMTVATGPEPEVERVVINEFVADPLGNDSLPGHDEWVEIYNAGNVSVDLAGWYLRDSRETPAGRKWLPSVTLDPGSFLILDVTENWLNNSSVDVVRLFNGSDILRDSREFDTPGDGVSIGRETDGGDIWKSCNINTKGTSNNGGC